MTMFNGLFKFLRLRGTLFLMVCSSLVLSACSGLKTTPEESVEGPVSVITGKTGGIKLTDLIKKNQPSLNMPVNALLWRAALDVSSFVPLDDVDTFGGTILTEWHKSTKNADERFKLAIFVIGLELRSDAVKVQTYTQKKLDNDWVDNGRDDALARKLEDLILTRARELRAASLSETTQ